LTRAGIKVVTAGLDKQPVIASRGMRLIPDMDLDQALQQDYDMLVLPGGLPGADHLNDDGRIQALVRRMATADKYVAAICAAPKVLATAGLLDNRRATSFPGALNQSTISGLDYRQEAVVVDHRLVTSRGPGTAMDFALKLIELLTTKAKRDEVESQLQRVQ